MPILNLIQLWVARFLDSFKLSSPTLFLVLAGLLTGLKYVLESGAIPVPGNILEPILWFIALFLNSSTFQVRKSAGDQV